MDFMTSLKLSNDNETEKPKEHSKRQSNHSLTNDQNLIQQDGFDESLDPEDDPAHANNRERRNPLPPRFEFFIQFLLQSINFFLDFNVHKKNVLVEILFVITMKMVLNKESIHQLKYLIFKQIQVL